MEQIAELLAIVVAGAVFIIGFLFAIPSPIDLAIIIAESAKPAMPSGTATQLIEQYILELRILGWIIMLGDVIGFSCFLP